MEKLGLNFPLLLFQLINFGILVAVLYSLLYKPITNMLRERTERIESSIKESDQVKQQLARAKQDYDTRMAEAKQEAAGILAQAQQRAKAQEAEIVTQARQDAERIRAEARVQAEREHDQMMRDAKSQLTELVVLATRQVLQSEMQTQGHEKLIDSVLADLARQN
ncbi:MAG: F0F1 ATP synthase subunit B [Chloroflexaceae bacterium]|nr:F0F1 ATP synthase subunit B [Chloroflexaceae bacterium]